MRTCVQCLESTFKSNQKVRHDDMLRSSILENWRQDDLRNLTIIKALMLSGQSLAYLVNSKPT